MQYLLLAANAPDRWDDPGPDGWSEDGDGVMADWVLYTKALADAGVLVAGAGLYPPEMATSVRVRAGERLVADAPFAEVKEHIIGFYLLELPDLDAALDWAAKIPNARTGVVEVRPVRPELGVEATLRRAGSAG